MNDDRAFERAIDDWLAGGSDRTPRPAVDAVLLAISTTPQERDLRIPWRSPTMSMPLRLVAVIAVIAVAGFAGLSYLGRGSGPAGGQSPTPSPTASPEPSPTPAPTPSPTPNLLDTSSWTPYTSSQYGFTLARPPDWSAVPATRAWTFEADAMNPVLTPAADAFDSPGRGVRVSAWSIPLDRTLNEGWSEMEAWVEAYCPRTDSTSCAGIRDRAVPLCNETRDCHPTALLVPFDNEVQAFFVRGDDADRMIIVSVWRGEDAPETAPYGGSRALLEALLSTMNVRPATEAELGPS